MSVPRIPVMEFEEIQAVVNHRKPAKNGKSVQIGENISDIL